jgi:glycosyltransferase involved in cell wall biosynthesis
MSSLAQLSVVLPVLNERDNLAELIPELCSALSPVLEGLEIIVVDDSSTDGTDLLLADLASRDARVRYISRKGLPASLPESLTDGVRAASFDHVAWMDADGSMPPESLVDLVRAYRSSSEINPTVVGSRFITGGGFKGIETVGETSVLQVIRNLRNSNDSLSAVLLSRVLNGYLWLLLGRCCRDLAPVKRASLILGFEVHTATTAFGSSILPIAAVAASSKFRTSVKFDATDIQKLAPHSGGSSSVARHM